MRIQIITTLILLSASLGAAPALKTSELVYRQVEFTIMDEEGKPIPGARVTASHPRPGNLQGETGEDGKLSLRLAVQVSLTLEVEHPDYYQSRGRIWQSGMQKRKAGEYIPREMPGSFEIVLKSIEDPRQLIYKMYRGHAPKSDQPIGFDLLVGDWIQPHGAGKVSDLLFHFHDINVNRDSFEGTMTISFPNDGDGIQPFTAPGINSQEFKSRLTPPRLAPVRGYKPRLSYTLSHSREQPWVDYKKPGRNYIFRSRTLKDASGKIRRACYGWISGEIEFDPRDPKGPQLAFTYHFNPDPNPTQRSLESVMFLK